jgi:hypothetical protein
MRSYRDYCRPPQQVERTSKAPGDRVLSLGAITVVPGEPEQTVVAMRGRKGRS